MTNGNDKTQRREFLRKSTLTATGAAFGLHAAKAPAVLSSTKPNDTVKVGFIGVGNRGTQLLHSFMKQPDMNVAALCDVYEPFRQRNLAKVDKELLKSLGGRIPKLDEKFDASVERYNDFRRVLERKDIDAVCIATPDHWHAIMAIMAFEAGKDVYVEKPLSITIHEGRKMAEAAQRSRRVNQVGLHRRSSNLYKKTAELIGADAIGKVTVARAYRISNMYQDGIGKYPDSKPVEGLDWDMWLGPRADRDSRRNIAPYKFRWWESYSSQMANWGVHYLDAMRWALDQQAPISVSAHGGRFAIDDDRTVPDTMEVIFEMPCKTLLIFGQYEACGGTAIEQGEVEFRGTLGNLYTGSEGSGYKIIPSDNGQFQKKSPSIKAVEVKRMDQDLTDQHVRNFLDCVKSRKRCNCDIETGHRSTTFAHLANIALATKCRIEWDAENERITNNDDANKLLHYEYREPWTLG